MGKITSFKDLKIWQMGMDVVKEVYSASNDFPRQELYGLTSQLRRSAISIPSNIAEGFKRYHNKEYKQFLYISMGSMAELETQLLIAFQLKFIKQPVMISIVDKLEQISKMTTSLIKKLN
ncbi:four helix bundle protein [Thermoproteota archaeon]